MESPHVEGPCCSEVVAIAEVRVGEARCLQLGDIVLGLSCSQGFRSPALAEAGDMLEAIVESKGGEYDGWEASAEE